MDVNSGNDAVLCACVQELYSSLLEFLKERGIDEKFAKEILQFYRIFEHRCFVEDFLGGIQQFCSEK